MTPFEKELEEILDTIEMNATEHERGNMTSNMLWAEQKVSIKAIKQAVDKYVIGEDRDWRLAATRPQMDMARSSNVLRRDMRQSLWGDKS